MTIKFQLETAGATRSAAHPNRKPVTIKIIVKFVVVLRGVRSHRRASVFADERKVRFVFVRMVEVGAKNVRAEGLVVIHQKLLGQHRGVHVAEGLHRYEVH